MVIFLPGRSVVFNLLITDCRYRPAQIDEREHTYRSKITQIVDLSISSSSIFYLPLVNEPIICNLSVQWEILAEMIGHVCLFLGFMYLPNMRRY